MRDGVRVRGNGDAVLAGKNEADNPRFDRFGPSGQLEGVAVTGPLEETAFGVYVAGPGSSRPTGQGFAPTSVGLWDQNVPLVTLNSPPDPNTQSRVSPYSQPPLLEAIADTRVGFAQGWRGVTYAYAIEARRGGKLLPTEVAPLTVIYVAQNNGIEINLSVDVSESVPLLVFGITPPYATELEAANSAEVYLHSSVSTRPRVPAVVQLWGNESRSQSLSFLSSGNKTYISGTPGKPEVRTRDRGEGKWMPQLAYSLKTPFGRSISSNVAVKENEEQRATWRPPSNPPQATAWIPEYVDSEGNWRSFSDQPIGRSVDLDTNVPEKLGPREKIEIDRNETDESGISGPDSALSSVTAIGKTLPSPGLFSVRITRRGVDPEGEEQEESAPSPIAQITIPTGSFLRVRPPTQAKNMFPNAEALLRDNLAGPEGWSRPASVGVSYTEPEVGKQRAQDVSSSASSQDVFVTPKARVVGLPVATAVLAVEVSSYITGRVDIVVRQTNNDNTTTEFTAASYQANGIYRFGVKFRPTGVNAVAVGQGYASIVYNADVRDVQLVVRHNGVSAGVRSLTATVWNLGMHIGLTHPAKRVAVDPVSLESTARRYASLSDEPASAPYPSSGYAMTVINPPNSQRALMPDATYVPGNLVEYYGPSGQPPVSAFFLSGARMSTKGGEQRTPSLFLWWEGVVNQTTPLRLLLKNEGGAVVQDLGGFVVDVTGDSRDYPGADVNGYVRISRSFIAHPEAVVAEIVPGATGDGLFRVMGHQYEFGAQATEFDDTYPQQGVLTSTFDLAIPGVPSGALKELSTIERVIGYGADVTHATVNDVRVTSHLVLARSKHYDDPLYSDWTEDPASLEIPANGEGTVQISTILATEDLSQTPLLHSHFFDFERTPDDNGMVVGSFLRGDGSEFAGTATAFDVPIMSTDKPILDEQFADFSKGYGVMGRESRWLHGFGVEFYLQSAAEEAVSLVGEGLEYDEDQDEEASLFQIWIQGRKYVVRVTGLAPAIEDREAYQPIPGLEHDGKWLIWAEGVEGEIIRVEEF